MAGKALLQKRLALKRGNGRRPGSGQKIVKTKPAKK